MLVFLVVLALRLVAAGHAYPADDAFITYRYAANLAHGHGFVYNAGDPVLGTTTPLLALLLAVPGALGLDVATAGTALCLVLSAVAVVLLFMLVQQQTGHRVAAGAAACWLAFSTHQNYLAVSGMETTLLVCLMLGSYLLLDRRRPLPAMALAGLTALVRPEGVVWLVLCSVALVVRHRRQAWLLVPALLPLVLWLVFSGAYFGSLIPQSVLAKRLQGGGPMAAATEWLTLLRPLGLPRLLVVLAAGGLAYALRRDRLLLVPLGFSIVFVAAYLAGGPSPYPWYPGPLDAALSLVVGVLLGRAFCRLEGRQRLTTREWLPVGVLVLFCVLLYTRADGIYRQFTCARPPEMHHTLAEWTQQHTRPGDTVLVGDVGYIGYYNLDRRVYDYYLLVWRPARALSHAGSPDQWLPDALGVLQPTVAIADASTADASGTHGYQPPGYQLERITPGYVAYRRL